MNLETNKILGGIGAILMFIGIMPVGNYLSFLELIGAIMILIALYGIGNYYKDSRIFRNALYGIITGIILILAMYFILNFVITKFIATPT